jgi:acyl-CoA reductase-like NAD-dependent aldehyde dehydrogenase
VKKISLELGANAPFIVFDDADIEMAVKGAAIASKYRNAGRTCACANRILLQDGVYDSFTKRLAETAGAIPSSASPPIYTAYTAATSAASGASPRRSNTASSASTRASSRPRSRRSAA